MAITLPFSTFCLSLLMSLHLFHRLSPSIFFYFCPSVCLSLHLSTCLSLHLSLTLYIFFCSSVCLFICIRCLSPYLSIYLSLNLSVHCLSLSTAGRRWWSPRCSAGSETVPPSPARRTSRLPKPRRSHPGGSLTAAEWKEPNSICHFLCFNLETWRSVLRCTEVFPCLATWTSRVPTVVSCF